MSRRTRLVFFAVAAAALAVALGVGLAGLPSFGSQLSAYARMLNELAPRQRHVTDVVSAISFDYRGIDTLFEEFILLAAVAGISVLLRPLSDEDARTVEDRILAGAEQQTTGQLRAALARAPHCAARPASPVACPPRRPWTSRARASGCSACSARTACSRSWHWPLRSPA